MLKYLMPGLAALAGLMFAPGAVAKPSAPITDVLLYPGGATITRTVQVSPGMKQAVITGLPADFDLQTLHAEASDDIRIGEIASTDEARTQAVNPAEAALDARITALRDRQGALDAEARSAQMVLDYLTGVVSRGRDGAPDDRRHAPPMDAKTVTGVATAMRTEAGKSLARIQALAVQKRELEKTIAALQRDLDHLRSSGTDTRTLTVSLGATRPGTLRVSYEVGNAGWKPAYRASLDSEKSTVALDRQAIISQNTGEDWTNVRLTLSTTQPRHATSGPDPEPWLLSYVVRMAARAMLEAPAAAPAAQGMLEKREAYANQADAAEDKPAYAPPTFETQGMFANRFEVPARTSLPADGREVSVELARRDIAVQQYFQSTPRRDAAVYVTAQADMPEGDWPQGTIQLFRNGSYIGSGVWDPQAKDKLVLGFGRDEQVRVSVVPLKDDSASSGIISRTRRQKIATLFTFVNRHQRPITLKVLEAGPVSTSDEVEVHTAFTPKPTHADWEDKRGVMEWETTLAAKGTTKIRTDYEIAYPSEGQLIGRR